MSLKSDILAVTLAGAVLLAAAWYAKKKAGAVVGGVADAVTSVGNSLKPSEGVKDVINAPIRLFDGYINAAGQWITGNDNWNQASWMHKPYEDYGVIDPSTWD